MARRKIYITDFDLSRLLELVEVAQAFGSKTRHDFDELMKELEQAKVVKSKKIPADVVTMNSKVSLRDLSNDELLEYTLVFPQDADFEEGKISVLAPIGTAIIGYAKGAEVEWPVPKGTRNLRVEEIVYQPEASGDYHL